MSLQDDLNALARKREGGYESTRTGGIQEHPGKLLRQLRHYLAEFTDTGKLKRTYELAIRSVAKPEEMTELICDGVEFVSESSLDFKILLEPCQRGCFGSLSSISHCSRDGCGTFAFI